MVVRSTVAAVYMAPLTVCAQWGRLLVFHTWESTSGTFDDSLGVTYLGGYSTVTMTGFQKYALDLDRVAWEVWWGPLDIPNNMGWTATGAGTGTLQAPGELRIATGANTRFYSRTPAGTAAEGMTVLVDMAVITGGSVADDRTAIRLINAASNDVSIRFSQTAIRVWDNQAGAQVGSDVSLAVSSGVQVLVSMATDKISLWARLTDTSHDRNWTPGPTNAAIVTGVAVNAELRWGNIASSTSESDWVQVSYTSDDFNGLGLHGGQTNPDDLWARQYSANLVAIDDGVKIKAIDGPARRGDLFNVNTRYDYAVERIFPPESRSPRVRFRSVDTAEHRIALALDTTLLGTAESEPGCDLVGIALLGINWRLGKLQRYDVGTAAWVTVATIDAATGMTPLVFLRNGNSVIPDGSTSPFNAVADEFRGSTFELSATVKRRIKWHAEGRWDSAYAGRKLQFHLESVAGADPGASAAGRLWAQNVVVLVNMAGEQGAGWRLVIDSQTTVDGYLEVGNIVIGPAFLFGTQYGWGRAQATERGWTRTEAQDRTSRIRETAPDPRVVSFAWEEGVDSSNVYGSDPDYVVASTTAGSLPVASKWGTILEVFGLSRQVRAHPVVYLPRVVKSTGAGTDVIHLTRREQFLYGVMDSDVEITSPLGNEQESTQGEIMRCAVVIREEV